MSPIENMATMKNNPVRWYRPLADLLFPRSCATCKRTITQENEESLCSSCVQELVPTAMPCLRCSAPLPTAHTQSTKAKKRCYYCENREWSFRKAYCYTAYAGTAARAARKIKQQSSEPLAIEIGDLLGGWLKANDHFAKVSYDYVLPVPQHWLRRVMHRYNQAEVLAERVALQIEVPMRRYWLYRSKWTEKQGTKTIVERRSSLTGSFDCKAISAIDGANLLLVDDIMTSGATAHEAASALRRRGAARIDVATFARGVGATTPLAGGR